MVEYQGKKWFCADSKKVTIKDEWGELKTVETKEFKMTRNYAQYLRLKKDLERKERIRNLKEKLDWQLKTYGEVDELDLNEFQALLKGEI